MAVLDRNSPHGFNCPICDLPLARKGPSISLEDAFKDWLPLHRFDEETIREHLRQSRSTQLHHCPNCLLEIFWPAVIGTELFYRELQEDAQLAYYRKDKWDFSIALKDVKGCQNIIEIGCGPGNFLELAKSHVQEACGIESSQTAMQLARSKGFKVYGAKRNNDSLAASFDAVFSFHVLEHVADPVGFVREISSMARPDGKICISVPNQGGPLRFVDNSVMNMPPHHASHWRLETLQALAEKLNLRITQVAFEPLLLENHNYYSYYWLNRLFPNPSGVKRKIKGLISILLTSFFRLLMRLGFKRFAFLRGQAIYVVLKKKR
jgi:2-polyprenyl-3-methyl-5-hydroxy-6-metoxy-1,4-benzoquinol methylase